MYLLSFLTALQLIQSKSLTHSTQATPSKHSLRQCQAPSHLILCKPVTRGLLSVEEGESQAQYVASLLHLQEHGSAWKD